MNATEWRTGVCLFLGLDDEIPVPQQCLSCGKPNSVAHGLTCKTGKAIFLRHEEAKDEIVACLQDAGYYVISAKNPHLEGDASVDGELFSDIKVRGLYYRQRYAHLDIRVIDTASYSRLGKDPVKALEAEESGKTQKYATTASREGSDFAPVIFSVHGSIAREANILITKCAAKIAGGKDARNYSTTVARLRARVQAAVVRATVMNLMGRTDRNDPAEKAKKRAAEIRRERALQRYDLHPHLS